MEGKIAPKHIISYSKLLNNGWTTARRMRFMKGKPAKLPCKFCRECCDSIEPMAKCPTVHKLFHRFIFTCRDMVEFMALDQQSFPERFLTKVKLINVLFNVHNTLLEDGSVEQINYLINASVSIVFRASLRKVGCVKPPARWC